jgi:twinkle protein
MITDHNGSNWDEYKLPCPECGGSDPVAKNKDGSAHCFSCDKHYHDYDKACESGGLEIKTTSTTVSKIKDHRNKLSVPSNGIFTDLHDRRIAKATAMKYGVKVVENTGDHIYPYYSGNQMVATKVRYKSHDGITKNFNITGSFSDTGLFGEQLFSKGGKYITLVEGECDAMAGYEMLGSKWAVVSIKRGAAGAVKDVKESLEFLESFDNVVICFDNDKAGKQAAQKIARLFTPSKAKIMTLPEQFNDPNEMLFANKSNDFSQAWWSSKTYTPAGVIKVSDYKASVPYPYAGLNKKLYGLRAGELVTFTGGTGLGKSSVTRELEHWLIKSTEDNVGIIALEEDPNRTISGILSIEANARLYIEQELEKFSEEEIDKYFDILYNGDNENRVWVHAHFGTNSIDDIFSKLRYMIVGCGCKWVVIDHLHMLVSAVFEGDERRAIDSIMTRLRSIVEETGAGIILVSHLRRVEGNKGHENGVQVNLSHLRGSQSIAQLSDCVIALERNQQADDPEEANTTVLRVLKSRYTGDVGLASRLLYDRETGRLNEIPAEDYEDDGNDMEFDDYA